MGWRIVVESDSAGYAYKEALRADLEADPRVDSVVDVGVGSGEDTDYPHVGVAAGQLVAAGEADRALLVCGTGIGVAMAAGTVPGVRASVATTRTRWSAWSSPTTRRCSRWASASSVSSWLAHWCPGGWTIGSTTRRRLHRRSRR